MAHQAVGAVIRSLPRFANDAGLGEAVRAMRTRLERADSSVGVTSRVPTAPDIAANFKIAPGGFYDIDFIASFLLVRSTGEDSTPVSWFPRGNIRDTLAGLQRAGTLVASDFEFLDQAAELLRATEHVVRLVQGRARKSLPTAAHARTTTERLVAEVAARKFEGGLEAELRRTAAQVRETFLRLVH